MKIAVIGGGIFGCTAAIYAARAGHEVVLYEQASSLLSGASFGNQHRLHEGYHYPRSPETARECREGNILFREEYGKAVIDGGKHYYAIANNGSKVTPDEYLRFCQSLDLPYKHASVGQYMNPEAVELVVEVEEGRISHSELLGLVEKKLNESHVVVKTNTPFSADMSRNYDRVIVAAYANTNACLAGLPRYDRNRLAQFQFEVVEKPVVIMPVSFQSTGIVIMDGEFGCVDPLGSSRFHLLGHVKHAIWHRNIGLTAEVPYPLIPYMDRGICTELARSNVAEFIEAGAEHIPALEEAEYVGSLFTVRAVLPGTDATDERPPLGDVMGKDQGECRYMRIFSGKIGTCVRAAQQAVGML